MAYSSRLWQSSSRVKTVEEIEWERKESWKRRLRRFGLVFLYALLIISFFV